MSLNQRQNRVLMAGGALWILSFVVIGVGDFATDNTTMHGALYGLLFLFLVQAVLQTAGAMVVAAIDADLDPFAKQHPRCAAAFALAWAVVLYQGLVALAPPIQAANQAFWLAACLPFAYLLLRFTPVLQMCSNKRYYPRFSGLLAWSLALGLGGAGLCALLYAPRATPTPFSGPSIISPPGPATPSASYLSSAERPSSGVTGTSAPPNPAAWHCRPPSMPISWQSVPAF
jgi:hypothetical protein